MGEFEVELYDGFRIRSWIKVGRFIFERTDGCFFCWVFWWVELYMDYSWDGLELSDMIILGFVVRWSFGGLFSWVLIGMFLGW